MANCEFYLKLMSQSLDGPLTAEAQQALDQHLSQCPDCRVLYRQLCEIHNEFSSWEEREVPEGFAQGVMDRVRALEEQSKRPKVIPLWKRPQFKALGSIAACAVLCIGIWRMDLLQNPQSPGQAADSGNAAASTTLTTGAADTADTSTAATTTAPATPAEEPQTKLLDAPTAENAAQPAAVAAGEDLAQNMPIAGAPMIVSEGGDLPQAYFMDRAEVPEEDTLLQSVTDVLGTTPGALLVLEEIPQELEGAWYFTSDGRAFLVVEASDLAALFQQLSPGALTALSLGEGPLVLVHWT